jgi:hypothetical protein
VATVPRIHEQTRASQDENPRGHHNRSDENTDQEDQESH